MKAQAVQALKEARKVPDPAIVCLASCAMFAESAPQTTPAEPPCDSSPAEALPGLRLSQPLVQTIQYPLN